MARPLAGLILALAGAWASTAAAGAPPADRYGPPPPAAVLPDVYAATTPSPISALEGRETMRAPPARMLSWPGKSTPQAATPASLPTQAALPAPVAAPVRTYPAPRYRTVAAPTTAAADVVTPRFVAPVAPMAAPPPAYFAAPTPGTPPPASTTLGGPLAARAPAAPTQRSRLYSVHREYGMQPDPAPIPPQFFAQTADLSAPATGDPIPNRAANAATRNAVNAARLAAAETN